MLMTRYGRNDDFASNLENCSYCAVFEINDPDPIIPRVSDEQITIAIKKDFCRLIQPCQQGIAIVARISSLTTPSRKVGIAAVVKGETLGARRWVVWPFQFRHSNYR